MTPGIRVLLPVALAFSLSAGAIFSITPAIRVDADGVGTVLSAPRTDPVLEGVEWSSRVTSPAGTQTAVVNRQVTVGTVLAGILAAGALLAAGAFEVLRNAARREELAIHRAVGASRRTLARVAATESALVTIFGLLTGWALGSSLVGLFLGSWPGPIEPGGSWVPGVTGAGILFVAFFGFSFGSWAAASGTGAASPGTVLRAPPADPYSGIAVLQVAGSVALMVVAAVLVRAAPGSDDAPMDGGIVAEVRSTGPIDTVRLLEGLEAVPGVMSAWLTSGGGGSGLGTTDLALTECGRCFIGTSPVNMKGEAAAHFTLATSLASGPLTIVKGRAFSSSDDASAEPVALVSESFAWRNFEQGEAIGRRVRPGSGVGGWHRVVGIVSDGVPRTGFGAESQPEAEVYLSAVQHPGRTADLHIRGAVSAEAVRAALEPVLPGASIDIVPLDGHRVRQAAAARWFGILFGTFGLVALLASLAGIGAVARLSLTLRRTELGVHRAVGANRMRVTRLALGQPLRAGLIGTVLGVWVSLFFMHTLSDTVGAPVPPVSVYLGIALLHIGAALFAALPVTLRYLSTSPHTLVAGME